MKYLECKFNDAMNKGGVEVTLDNIGYLQERQFQVSWSLIQESLDISNDVKYCIGAAWMKQRLVSKVV